VPNRGLHFAAIGETLEKIDFLWDRQEIRLEEEEDRAVSGDDFDEWAVHHDGFYPPGSRLDREFRLSRKLLLAGRRWTNHIDGLIRRQTGQSRARWQTMFTIAFSAPPVTVIALAQRLEVRWPTLIRVLDDLERDGFVRRWDNPADRRSRLLALSPKGESTVAEVQTILDPARHEILKDLGEEEILLSTTLLDHILTHTPGRGAAGRH